VALRDAGEALPAAAALMSPHVDLTSSGASMTERADQDPIFTPAALRQMGSSHTLDRLDTCFDDTHAIANAGLLLPATLAERLGIQQATMR
jgi:acetyl esterase/lipase